MDRNDRKVETIASMHWYAFVRSYKRQIVTDTKSRKTSHTISFWLMTKIEAVDRMRNAHLSEKSGQL